MSAAAGATAPEARWARQALIPGWRQERLAAAQVVIAGVGALGNEVARLLALVGVGSFLLCDPDHIEESNLSRTALFRARDVGRRKVDAAAAALRELAPGVTVEARPLPLVHGVGLAELREAKLVLGCLDSRAARLQLAGRANLTAAPVIDGGTQPWGGEVRLFLDSQGPCYGCTLSEAERAVADEPWSCLDEPAGRPAAAAAPSSALVGAWMAQMAVRFLMELPVPAGVLSIDVERGATRLAPASRNSACPLHRAIGAAERLPVSFRSSVRELQAALGGERGALAWEPFMERVECPACGFAESRFGLLDGRGQCPRCGARLRPRGTLEIDAAPGHLTLGALGVAPREILAVRTGDTLSWIELAPGRDGVPEREEEHA